MVPLNRVGHIALRAQVRKLFLLRRKANLGLQKSNCALCALKFLGATFNQGCGAGTGTGRNRIHLETLEPEPEPYSEYGSGSEYKKMKLTTPKN